MRPTAFSLPGMVREEKIDEVALVERDLRMLLLGDARQRRARLALAAGAQQYDVAAVEVGELVLVEVAEALRQVAGVDGDLDHAVQGAAGDDELPVGGAARLRPRL